MAFTLSGNQPSLSDEAQKKGANESVAIDSVSSQLLLKSPAQSLDKGAVLRRLRHHKTMSRVKAALSESDVDKWLHAFSP